MLSIRFAQIKDLPKIVEIYNQAIRSNRATGDLDEFTVEERKKWFIQFDPNSFPIYVSVLDEQVVGFCTLSPYRPGKRAMAAIAEVSYYVEENHFKKGIGSRLLQFSIAEAKRLNKKTLLAILLEVNVKSIKLLEKEGFTQWGHLPNCIQLNDIVCGHLIYGKALT